MVWKKVNLDLVEAIVVDTDITKASSIEELVKRESAYVASNPDSFAALMYYMPVAIYHDDVYPLNSVQERYDISKRILKIIKNSGWVVQRKDWSARSEFYMNPKLLKILTVLKLIRRI